MPRLPPSLFWRARREISPLAAQLLPACRDLESAANELRWIREHVQDTKSAIPNTLRVWKLVDKRARGVPLQYVLGTQPFGDLEIKCRPGVLIPRPETEAYTLYLASILSHSQPPNHSLSILDLCTGTGCIPLLLLHSLLTNPSTRDIPIHIHGVDISPHAVALARENQAYNTAVLHHLPPPSSSGVRYTLDFTQQDIFSPTFISQTRSPALDLLVSNPPYISPRDFATATARAVRNYEPRLALVPGHQHHHLSSDGSSPENEEDAEFGQRHGCRPEDIFYARLREIAAALRPRRVLVEVGGWEQAQRVVGLFLGGSGRSGDDAGGNVEIWRDEPAAGDRGEKVELAGREVVVRGVGKGRAVYLYNDNV
ncbi:S-adenosyl-L-methionine-dependent methyltransferase [Corynascus similis CBS 632.67]